MRALFSSSPFPIGVTENMQDLNQVPKALLKIIVYFFFRRVNLSELTSMHQDISQELISNHVCASFLTLCYRVSFDMKVIS